MPTLTQLEYIIAVDKFRHFGQAAKSCNVSQPSLSMQIQKVEDLLGITIFDRDKKPVLPTAAGEHFIQQAKAILREHKKLLDISKVELNEISGNFQLGIIPTLAPYVLPLFIKEFSEKYPKVDLHIDELKTEDIIERLNRDQLDAGLLATPLDESGIKEEVLFYEPFYLYASKDSPLANKKKIKESDLDKDSTWLLQDGHCFKNQVINVCSLQDVGRVFPNIYFEGGNLETLRYIIKNSKGYTLLPSLFVDSLPKAERDKYVKPFLPPIPTREVSLVYRRSHWKLNIIQALAELIKAKIPKELLKKVRQNQQIIDIT